MKGIVPNFFTMANMFCGFYATILSAQAMWGEQEESKFITAAWLIVAAFVMDGLDGKLARLTHSSSEFGIQYDSMADVISFGLAPSVLSYYVFFHQWGTIGLLISFVPLVFGSIRLARFNVKTSGAKDKFEGLPIPTAALTIASFIIFNFEFWGNLRWSKIFLSLVILVSLLMITNIRYEIIPDFSLQTSRANRIKILIFIVFALIIILFPQQTFFPIIIAYVLSGVLRVAWEIITQKNDRKYIEAKENLE